jgi:hypothetical protein
LTAETGLGNGTRTTDIATRPISPWMSSRVPLPTPSPAEGLHRVCVAIRYGREHSTGLKFEPLVEVRGLPVCAPALIKGGQRNPQDLSRQVLIHLDAVNRAR